jgi:hypothetical protein
MTFPWREQPAALLEQHFNPRVAVPSFQEALELPSRGVHGVWLAPRACLARLPFIPT